MKQDIYNMFKSGKSTAQIYDTFVREYEQAKSQYRAEQQAEIEAARKAKEEAEKAAALARQNAQTKPGASHLPRFRRNLTEAFYDYLDYLLPEPLEYDECTEMIDEVLNEFETGYSKWYDVFSQLSEILSPSEDTKTEQPSKWEATVSDRVAINNKTVSEHTRNFNSSETLQDIDDKINTFITDYYDDRKIIQDYIRELLK